MTISAGGASSSFVLANAGEFNYPDAEASDPKIGGHFPGITSIETKLTLGRPKSDVNLVACMAAKHSSGRLWHNYISKIPINPCLPSDILTINYLEPEGSSSRLCAPFVHLLIIYYKARQSLASPSDNIRRNSGLLPKNGIVICVVDRASLVHYERITRRSRKRSHTNQPVAFIETIDRKLCCRTTVNSGPLSISAPKGALNPGLSIRCWVSILTSNFEPSLDDSNESNGFAQFATCPHSPFWSRETRAFLSSIFHCA